MEKVKYIIIFTLILALGLIYLQLIDYKNITNTLIKQNNNFENQVKNLNTNNTQLHNKIQSLEKEIIILEENLSNINAKNKDIKILYFDFNQSKENNTTIDNNTTQQSDNNNTKIDENLTFENNTTNKTKSTLYDQNSITGFGSQEKDEEDGFSQNE